MHFSLVEINFKHITQLNMHSDPCTNVYMCHKYLYISS